MRGKCYICVSLDFFLLRFNVDEFSDSIGKLPLTLFQQKFTKVCRRLRISLRCHFYGG